MIPGRRLKPAETILSITKSTTGYLILLISVSNKYHPIFIHENEVTEPHINNSVNNDVDKYKDTFNNNMESNVTTSKKRPTPVINQFPERDTLSVSKQSKNLIPGYANYNETVRFGRKAYVIGTSMIKSIRNAIADLDRL